MRPGAEKAAGAVGDFMARSKPFLLTVLTGPNAGASAKFAEGRLRIGGGDEDEIVLAGLPPACLTLRTSGGRLAAVAGTEGVSSHDAGSGQDVALVKDGTVFKTELPATLRLNSETMITISRLGASRHLSLGVGAAAGVAAATLAVGLWAGAYFGDVPGPGQARAAALQPEPAALASAPAPAAAPAAEPEPEIEADLQHISCDSACATAAVDALQETLIDAGLDGLSVVPSDGVLRVRGELQSDRIEQWRDIRARFETEFGQALPLIVEIGEGAPDPVLSISSVWLGAAPEIRTKSGKVLRIGDATGDGWTISSIAKGEIVLQRGERMRSLRF